MRMSRLQLIWRAHSLPGELIHDVELLERVRYSESLEGVANGISLIGSNHHGRGGGRFRTFPEVEERESIGHRNS